MGEVLSRTLRTSTRDSYKRDVERQGSQFDVDASVSATLHAKKVEVDLSITIELPPIAEELDKPESRGLNPNPKCSAFVPVYAYPQFGVAHLIDGGLPEPKKWFILEKKDDGKIIYKHSETGILVCWMDDLKQYANMIPCGGTESESQSSRSNAGASAFVQVYACSYFGLASPIDGDLLEPAKWFVLEEK